MVVCWCPLCHRNQIYISPPTLVPFLLDPFSSKCIACLCRLCHILKLLNSFLYPFVFDHHRSDTWSVFPSSLALQFLPNFSLRWGMYGTEQKIANLLGMQINTPAVAPGMILSWKSQICWANKSALWLWLRVWWLIDYLYSITSWIANLGVLLYCVGKQWPYAEKPRLIFCFFYFVAADATSRIDV